MEKPAVRVRSKGPRRPKSPDPKKLRQAAVEDDPKAPKRKVSFGSPSVHKIDAENPPSKSRSSHKDMGEDEAESIFQGLKEPTRVNFAMLVTPLLILEAMIFAGGIPICRNCLRERGSGPSQMGSRVRGAANKNPLSKFSLRFCFLVSNH